MAKNTPIIKDWFMFGFTVGVVSSVAKTFFNAAIHKAGVPTIRYGSVAAGLVLGKKPRLFGIIPAKPRTRGEWLIGYATDAFMGGIFGASVAYLKTKMPPGYAVHKGAILGAAIGGGSLILGNELRIDHMIKLSPIKISTFIATAALFGGLEGTFIQRFGTKMITQSHPTLTKEVSGQTFQEQRLSVKNTSHR
jgi:hypothetical protein